ncbi:MAG: hypothetical protein PHU43_03845 [Candidatus Bipolaricaulis sp.]|nr:hypothetical protein [Candidatus Bipolaricaulis sp.]
MDSIRLRDIERKSWRTYQQDGLTDVQFGGLMLAAAMVAVLDQLGAPPWARIVTLTVLAFLEVAAIVWMRRRYVAPRLGTVKFAPWRVRRTRAMRIMLAACVLATASLVVLTSLSKGLGIALPGDVGAWLIVSAVILVPVGGLALFLDYPRLLLHGGLFVVVEFLHIVAKLPSRFPFGGAIAYGTAACVSLAVGIGVYVRFLRVVPRPVLAPSEPCEEDARAAR